MAKPTVATLSEEVKSLREQLVEIKALREVLDDFKDSLDGLTSRVSQLEAITAGLAVEVDGEKSPISLAAIKHNIDQLCGWAIEAEHSIRNNEEQFLKVKKVADRYGISA